MEDVSASLIPVANHRDICHRCFDAAEIIGCQFKVKRADVLIQTMELARAGDMVAFLSAQDGNIWLLEIPES